MPTLATQREQLEGVISDISKLADAADLTDGYSTEQATKLTTLLSEGKTLREGIEVATKQASDAKAASELSSFLSDLGTDDKNVDAETKGVLDGIQKATNRSLSEQFVSDDAVKSWFEGIKSDGHISDNTTIHSPAMRIKTLLTGTDQTSAGALVRDDWRGLMNSDELFRQLGFIDLITRGNTTSDTVSYAKVDTFTNAADTVAEATATDGTDLNGVKPESALTFAVVSEFVRTIAHWIPATNRAIADAGQLRTIIDQFLLYGLREKLNEQMIAGDGTGENFVGLESISGMLTQPFDTDILITARKAVTQARLVQGATPTAWVMNPVDWEAYDLLVDGTGGYRFGGPLVMGQKSLWGIPVIEEQSVTAGFSYLGDYRKLVLWDREAASVQLSNQHEDFFVRNMVAVLAEMRAAYGCLQPSAFIKTDLTV